MNTDSMKGLELSEKFYKSVKNTLEKNIPDILAKSAIGLVGEGSECFGFDDEISRDHDWGPGFCIWMPQDILASNIERIDATLSELPCEFYGFQTKMNPTRRIGRTGPLSIEGFFKSLGISKLPQTLQDWRLIDETSLASATNGKIFEDNAGIFTQWRDALLAYYPEDIRKKKIAARCMNASQACQYNLIRCLQRRDFATAFICTSRFLDNALSLAYLLRREYMPFYKWACHKARLMSHPACDVAKMADLFADAKWSDAQWGMEMIQKIESICSLIADEIKSQGLSDANGNWLWEIGIDVQRHIEDHNIRSLNAMKD